MMIQYQKNLGGQLIVWQNLKLIMLDGKVFHL